MAKVAALALASGLLVLGCSNTHRVHGRLNSRVRAHPGVPLHLGLGEAGPMQAYPVAHGDPLWGKGPSALETPLLAPSSGRYGAITSPQIDGYRRIGVWKDD